MLHQVECPVTSLEPVKSAGKGRFSILPSSELLPWAVSFHISVCSIYSLSLRLLVRKDIDEGTIRPTSHRQAYDQKLRHREGLHVKRGVKTSDLGFIHPYFAVNTGDFAYRQNKPQVNLIGQNVTLFAATSRLFRLYSRASGLRIHWR